MATMGVKVFCDTNIVIRYNVVETPERELIKSAVERLIENKAELWISRQVIREFCIVLTRPQTFLRLITSKQVVERIYSLTSYFQIADETLEVTTHLLELLEVYPIGGKQVHDANIVATMQAYRIPQLFTLNTADFARFSTLVTLLTPDDILRPPSTPDA